MHLNLREGYTWREWNIFTPDGKRFFPIIHGYIRKEPDMHDSHEEGYRYQRPQACIDELRAVVKAAEIELTRLRVVHLPEFSGKIGEPDKAIRDQARATLEKTRP